MEPARDPVLLLVLLLSFSNFCGAQQLLHAKMQHLRSGPQREWDEFPAQAEGKELLLRFPARKNDSEHTLRLRQRDVKQSWGVRLNDKEVGVLHLDEKDTVIVLKLAASALRDGENELKIACKAGASAASDDIMVGDLSILPISPSAALAESTINVEVMDGDTKAPIPARITIIDANGSVPGLGPPSSAKVAVRPGVVYTGDGKARITLSAGKYTIYAGRGFEYSLDSTQVELKAGESIDKKFSIRRVVATPGYVSCDPHIHTFTYSRHGDAEIDERMITLAGENIELPIATDHNLQIDFAPVAEKLGLNQFFTPVIGNEVTTGTQAHFNVFPIPPETKLINFRAANWDALAASIAQIAAPEPIIILNHARDIHGGFRPHDPKYFIALTGQRLDDRKLFANAMEVVNSGAVMSDPMRLYKDWFGLLNRGYKITPVGASDSHDVSRYIVGQARTYIRCDDSDPGKINIDEARKNFLAGKVLVSYGLLTDITVNKKFGPGDLVSATGDIDVEVKVQAPAWSKAARVVLYANGIEIRSADITTLPSTHQWTLPKPRHDIHLAAIATGPGISGNYWPTAKPYQPTTTEFTSYTIGSTGAVFIDADHNNRFDSAYRYAVNLLLASDTPPAEKLADCDEAVIAQLASILRDGGGGTFASVPHARRAFDAYQAEWKEHLAAKAAATKPATRPN